MVTLKRHFWLFWGLTFLMIFAATPLLWTYFQTPPSSVWVPINDQYKLCGDDKVYGAMVHEQSENFFSFSNPVSNEIGTYGVSIFRELSLKLTLFLGFFLENSRLLFALSLILGILISFTLMYTVVYAFIGSSFIAAVATWITFLYFKLFSPELNLSGFSENILNAQRNLFFESYNDHFRYVVLHSAYIFFWPLIFAIAKYKPIPSFKWVLLLSITLAGLIYSYQPLTIIGSLILFFWLIVLALNKEYDAIKKVFLSATLAIILVSCFGFWGHLKLFLNSPSEALTQHFAPAQQPLWKVIKSILINQHAIILLVLAIFAKKHRGLQQLLWATLAAVILLKCFKLNPNYVLFVDRIFHRGFDTFWLLLSLSSLMWILSQTQIIRFLSLSKSAYPLLFVGLIIPNLICTQRMAEALAKDESYLMAKNQWATYDYIAKKTPKKSVFMAIDVRDNQLLPVYTSANLFFSMPFGSNIKTEFNKFLLSWKFLGYHRSILESWLSSYIDSYFSFRCSPTPNRPTFEDSFAYVTMANILYDPYILYYGNIPIRDATMTKFTDAFVKEVFRQFDNADLTEIEKNVDYVLITKNMPGGMKYETFKNKHFLKVDFENDHHILFKNINKL